MNVYFNLWAKNSAKLLQIIEIQKFFSKKISKFVIFL